MPGKKEKKELIRKKEGEKMKLRNIEQVEKFLEVVNSCSGNVLLKSNQQDIYNLKSTLSQYVAIGALLGEKGDELELFCDNKEDELKFISFLSANPEIL